MKDTSGRIGTFPSRTDGWLALLLFAAAAVEVIAAVALIAAGPASVWSGRVLPSVIGWTLFGTGYRVDGTDLVIHSGPFRRRVSIASIASVAPTHSVNAALALSTTRLDLSCSGPDRHVLVSPREPAAFIAALRAVKPSIIAVGGEPARA